MNKILIIVGTVREGRVGRKIADWYLKEAKKVATNMEFEILDVKEEDLPLFNEATPPLYNQYSKRQVELAKKIADADGFVFVTGEYNHSIPGSLKNLLDYLVAEWNHKAAAYVGYGGTGAIRAIEHLVQIMNELRVTSVANTSDNIHINTVWEAFDENDKLKPEFVHGDIEKQLKELNWWVEALKVARVK